MSCGEPDDIHCQDFLTEVYLFLDCECPAERQDELERHMRECHPCLEKYGIERDLKSLVRRGCSGEKAPDELRLRLRAQIRSLVMTQSPDSGRTTASTTTTTETVRGQDGAVTRVSETTWQVTNRPVDR